MNTPIMRNAVLPEEMTAMFDDQSPMWSTDPEFNALFLRCQRNHANDVLQSRGHLFLNEVHDMLGLPRTSQGQLVGWLIPGSVEFWEGELEAGSDILLKFNVDGVIYEAIA